MEQSVDEKEYLSLLLDEILVFLWWILEHRLILIPDICRDAHSVVDIIAQNAQLQCKSPDLHSMFDEV